MNKEEQINEIARLLNTVCVEVPHEVCQTELFCSICQARRIYDAGYRKQAETDADKDGGAT